nr:ABC transporter ATP-binding protein [bacterium]
MAQAQSPQPQMPTFQRAGGGGGPARFAPGAKPKNAKGTLRRILGIYMRWGKTIMGAMALTALSSAIAVAVPYLVGQTFNAFDIQHHLVDTSILGWLLIALGALHITNWGISTLSGVMMLRVSQRLVFVLRKEFFKKMQRLPLSFFDTRPHGDTMSRLTNDVDNISSTIAQATTQLVSSLLTIIGSLTVMVTLNLPLTAIVLLCVPLVAGLTRLIARRSRAYFLAQQRALGGLNGIIEENILGLKMVKAFGRQQEVVSNFSVLNEQLYQSSYRAQTWSGYMMPLMNVINNFIFTLVAICGGALSARGDLAVGTVISFLSYSKQFAHPLNSVASMFNTIQAALAGAERVFEILDQQEESPDAPQAIALEHPRGEVTFEDVCFCYTPGKPVLSHISFHVNAGETIALVGETGAGKTTVVNLLTRFYDADSGSIQIDGVDIGHIRRDSLRNCFSVVLQDTCLFTGTIMDNIRYSRPDASDSQVVQAAKLAHAHDFISRLPQGYQTPVSGSTDTLSQGQRQLLAIARAVLCDCPILILDEATSSVDTKTEKDIQRALLNLMKSHTSFLIAHRLSTIRDADRILVIGEGQILEQGNHAQLMALRGRYFAMVQSQMGLEIAPDIQGTL